MLTERTEASPRARRVSVALAVCVACASAPAGCAGDVERAPAAESSEQAFCAKQCEVPADCCRSEALDCPGAYPDNWGCEEGLCVAPRCERDADCTGGACRAEGGLHLCVRLCSEDADCDEAGSGLGASTCQGVADDGTKFCGGGVPACERDDDCLDPASHCLASGRCGCRDDGDCSAAPFKTCRGGVCSCSSDEECGPALDACTTERAYAYPPSAGAKPGLGGPSGSAGSGG